MPGPVRAATQTGVDTDPRRREGLEEVVRGIGSVAASSWRSPFLRSACRARQAQRERVAARRRRQIHDQGYSHVRSTEGDTARAAHRQRLRRGRPVAVSLLHNAKSSEVAIAARTAQEVTDSPTAAEFAEGCIQEAFSPPRRTTSAPTRPAPPTRLRRGRLPHRAGMPREPVPEHRPARGRGGQMHRAARSDPPAQEVIGTAPEGLANWLSVTGDEIVGEAAPTTPPRSARRPGSDRCHVGRRWRRRRWLVVPLVAAGGGRPGGPCPDRQSLRQAELTRRRTGTSTRNRASGSLYPLGKREAPALSSLRGGPGRGHRALRPARLRRALERRRERHRRGHRTTASGPTRPGSASRRSTGPVAPRSPTTAARSSCSTSGPPGASRAATSRRCSSAGTSGSQARGRHRARRRRPRRRPRRARVHRASSGSPTRSCATTTATPAPDSASSAYPETFVIDRRGRIAALVRGPVDERVHARARSRRC